MHIEGMKGEEGRDVGRNVRMRRGEGHTQRGDERGGREGCWKEC